MFNPILRFVAMNAYTKFIPFVRVDFLYYDL